MRDDCSYLSQTPAATQIHRLRQFQIRCFKKPLLNQIPTLLQPLDTETSFRPFKMKLTQQNKKNLPFFLIKVLFILHGHDLYKIKACALKFSSFYYLSGRHERVSRSDADAVPETDVVQFLSGQKVCNFICEKIKTVKIVKSANLNIIQKTNTSMMLDRNGKALH